MSAPICDTCGCDLTGKTGWAHDWKVINTSGKAATFRTETRYTCDDCEAKR